eukprot:jgi/Tetstr1/466117/TSEL_010680.t1
METHVDAQRSKMFLAAVEPVMAGLNEMKDTIVKAVEGGFGGLQPEMDVGYSPLWSAANPEMLKARRELAPAVNSIKMEATNALWKLMRAQGREVQGPNIDDEDIEDVTAAAQAAKAGTADVVDLTRDDAVVQPDPVPYWTNVKQERAEKAAAS